MAKKLNRGLHITVSNESALKVNGTEIINSSGAIIGDIQATAGSIGTAELAAAGVTLAKLAAGVTPSHVIKFFKLGSTITTTALAGLAVNDMIISILADGTVTVAACAVANTLPADPADTSYLLVLRAAA